MGAARRKPRPGETEPKGFNLHLPREADPEGEGLRGVFRVPEINITACGKPELSWHNPNILQGAGQAQVVVFRTIA
jgi:hypothetical protein